MICDPYSTFAARAAYLANFGLTAEIVTSMLTSRYAKRARSSIG